ncbi:MFS family permease [Actinoplanes lutulentus]|uniref:MFS transporter n=1 Tax=Actinoplanes lutulentus TaxID=1287878 RepID=A0A327ZEF0_9ACTN|nr:MFS transporter [Actinoplanes lutulentus]MBB2942688.1 MFS family permease [Actinoplanes lutulentus]RAK38269.1 MFS transporter [Actinoplanes lutulentus]
MTEPESSPKAEKPVPLWKLDGPQALLAAGSFLNAVAFFSALPFASLYLASYTSMSNAAIGAVVGGIALIASIGGVAGGMLVDRVGAVPLMGVGLSLYIAIYAGLSVVRDTSVIIGLLLGLGVARLFVEPGGKKLMSLAAGADGRIFRLRYMILCGGAIVGPAIGGLLYAISPKVFFAVPAVLYAIYLVLIVARRSMLTRLENRPDEVTGHFPLSAALRDVRLLAATGAGLAIFFVFSQLESIIPLYIKGEWGDDAVKYFAGLFITNAILALAFQVPIDWVSNRISRTGLVLIGCCGFAAAFLCFWASGFAGLALLYLGIVFWTIGEGVLLPMPDIAVHEIATDDRKGAYFGFAEIRYLGFFAGPFAGGVLLSGRDLGYFAIMAAFVFLCVPLLLARRFTAAPAEGSVHAQA